MYRWYEESSQCIVFLEDYVPDDRSSLSQCEWFKRGWTLQELIAPSYCIFFTKTWSVIGHKPSKYGPNRWRPAARSASNDEVAQRPTSTIGPDLTEDLITITRIPKRFLNNESFMDKEPFLDSASVAQRMSWASQRTTTRVEDRAYSLLGIFNINMPLLYGEGYKAFQRLQEEIIRRSSDASIFCYGETKQLTIDVLSSISSEDTWLLPRSPASYKTWNDMCHGTFASSEPYAITNKGLRVFTSAYIPRLKPSPKGLPVYAIPIQQQGGESHDGPGVRGHKYVVVLGNRHEEKHVMKIGLGSNKVYSDVLMDANGGEWKRIEPSLFYIQVGYGQNF